MGSKICGCDNQNDPGKDTETNVVSIYKYLNEYYIFSLVIPLKCIKIKIKLIQISKII